MAFSLLYMLFFFFFFFFFFFNFLYGGYIDFLDTLLSCCEGNGRKKETGIPGQPLHKRDKIEKPPLFIIYSL